MRSLILFFDLYCSMTKYDREGLLARDLLLYEKLIECGAFDVVHIFTYDHRDAAKLAEMQRERRVSTGIRVLVPPPGLRNRLGAMVYSLIGPLVHRRVMAEATVLKTHQVSASWTGLIAKWLFGKPLLFRLGYPLSVRFSMENKPIKSRLTRMIETLMVRCSDHVAVTSRTMQAYYGAMGPGQTVTLVPSYVDVSGFTPITTYDAGLPILYIGRLEQVKNVASLIPACGRLGVELDIYGGGRLEASLKSLAAECGATVRFHGYVSNAELMRVHHDHSVCVLCSTREGMPKSLIEAMASGLVCVSTRTDGALELIEEGVTGHLTDGFDADALERTLRRVLANLDGDVGRRASAFVRRQNSLKHCLDIELEVLGRICVPKEDHAAPLQAVR